MMALRKYFRFRFRRHVSFSIWRLASFRRQCRLYINFDFISKSVEESLKNISSKEIFILLTELKNYFLSPQRTPLGYGCTLVVAKHEKSVRFA